MDDYYDDESSPSQAQGAPADSDNDKSDETEDKLALVPKHFFKEEPKPGMREMVEVVEVYEGECSIKCVYGEDEDKDKDEMQEEEMSEAPDEMMT